MTIIYIIGGKTDCDWFDLKCSLRSVAKFGSGIDKIAVAGDAPAWLSDSVEKWGFEQPYPSPSGFKEKHANLRETLRFIAGREDCPDEFIVGFSDVFLTSKVDFNEYPYYAKLTERGISIPSNSRTEYGQSLKSACAFLAEKNLPSKNMTMHRFIRMRKSDINECAGLFDEVAQRNIDVEPFILIGNYMLSKDPIFVKPVKDYKISMGDEWWKSSKEITDCFSIRHLYYGPLYTLMSSAFPQKSKYEQ